MTTFLAELAADYEKALREADRLRDDLGRALAVVQEHREQERSLQTTLTTAQKLADEIRHTAEQESERIIAEGQARAAAVLEGTAPRAAALDGEIASLRERRNQAAAELDATIATLRATLRAVKMQAASSSPPLRGCWTPPGSRPRGQSRRISSQAFLPWAWALCIVHRAFLMAVFAPTPAGATCTVRVTPRAGRTTISARDGHLVVKLAAAPVDGAANAALVDALAAAFHLPRRAVTLVAGQRSRTKRVAFEGVTPAALDGRLATILDE